MKDSKKSNQSVKIPDSVINTLARQLLPKIQTFFDSSEGKKAFENRQQEKIKNP